MTLDAADGRHSLRRSGLTLLSGIALACWAVLLLDTTYLEPLSWDAAKLGLIVLLVATVGAGLLSGWRVETAFLPLVVVPALIFLAPTPMVDFGKSEQQSNGALHMLWLCPVALAIGAFASTRSSRAQVAGALLLALPLVVVAWGGLRHVRPLNREPTQPLLIEWKGVQVPTYRGLASGDDRARVLALLGRPDREVWSGSGVDLVYGRDTIYLQRDRVGSFDIADPSAETSEGVGIGDNLALVKQRLPVEPNDCRYSHGTLKAECRVRLGRTHLDFENDPITAIHIS